MSVLLTRQPLINTEGKIIATRLIVHASAGLGSGEAAEEMNRLAEYWPASGRAIFVAFTGVGNDLRLLDWVAPENVTLELPASALAGEHAAEFVPALNDSGMSLCLDFDAEAGKALASGAKFRFIAFDATSFSPAQLGMLVTRVQAYGIPIAINVDNRNEFAVCTGAGVTAVSGWFVCEAGAQPAKKLNASQAHIVRVLNLVRRNADVREIEVALKQDVALTYKLLRYINSAGFGLSCEVQSFRHAVTILGYEKLNKWLSLLLVTASKDPMAPTLMHAALIRGRFMEQLAHGLVDAAEWDNLFITGAFSLLDRLLGVSMDQALEAMHLPEPIADALLGRGGVYAPFLDLARASEAVTVRVLREQAGLLGLSEEQVNRAHLKALAFADEMLD